MKIVAVGYVERDSAGAVSNIVGFVKDIETLEFDKTERIGFDESIGYVVVKLLIKKWKGTARSDYALLDDLGEEVRG